MSELRPHYLRVEYKQNPLGLDAAHPRLSWLVEAEGRGRRQTAYQILVASSEENLAADNGDLWDSGKVASAECAQIVYAGLPLGSRMQCFWKARVWDEQDRPGAWSEAAHWTMGLLDASDWRAQWIGFDEPFPRAAQRQKPIALDDASWMSLHADTTAAIEPGRCMVLRRTIALPALDDIADIRMALSSSDQFTLHVNGVLVGESEEGTGRHMFPRYFDLSPWVHEGVNVIGVVHWQLVPCAPALIGKIEIERPDGSTQVLRLDEAWRAAWDPADGWQAADLDDAAWEHPVPVAKMGEGPWGRLFTAPADYPPCPYLRQTFSVDRQVARATVHASALGVFEFYLNGEKAGEDCFTPGWSDYTTRVYYLTYDVTHAVRQGENVAGVMLGHGWYSGYIGWDTFTRGHYGKDPRALVQLEIEYTDGTREIVSTDEAWRASYGPILGSDFYRGCLYDAQQEMTGWNAPGYDAGAWRPVVVDASGAPPLLQAYPGIPVRRIQELPALQCTEAAPGVFIFDLGQNMVGWVRLKVSGPAGTRVRLRHGEMLSPDGTLYVRNLRGARCVDEYWLRGDGEEVWEPTFTFHGFRYVELTGCPGVPPLEAVTGIVVHNDLPITGAFACSDERINQLQRNILWGQRGNFLEAPTDCPQRDERLGWMGDAQVFAPTACFNMDVAPFFTKWLRDVRDGQSPEGNFPDVAPRVLAGPDGAPAWANAGIIVPWVIYQAYNDPALLAENYNAMARWVDFADRENPDHRWINRVGANYGDWLAVGEDTPKDVISTAYFARSAQLVADAARILGHAAHAERYSALAAKVREAFVSHYVDADGRVHGDTQTGYALALVFDLLPGDLRPKAAAHLVANIRRRGTRLTTGFVGCPLLMYALSENGALDVAYELLQSEEYPSWLYPVKQGATTIWERWDGWTHDRGFQDPGMNSFNHYAFGAVGDWMYRNVAGIDAAPEEPGYGRIVLRPRPGGTLTWAEARYDSIRGTITSRWERDEHELRVAVSIPVSTEAVLHLPVADPGLVRESGGAPAESEGVSFEGVDADGCRYALQSGSYQFVCRLR